MFFFGGMNKRMSIHAFTGWHWITSLFCVSPIFDFEYYLAYIKFSNINQCRAHFQSGTSCSLTCPQLALCSVNMSLDVFRSLECDGSV